MSFANVARELNRSPECLNATLAWTDNVGDGALVENDVTVAGAALGDFVLVSCSADLAGCSLSAYVSAADTVTIVVDNNTGAAMNTDVTFYVLVIPKIG